MPIYVKYNLEEWNYYVKYNSFEEIKNYEQVVDINCSNNLLNLLPKLPNSLKEFYCYNNQLTSLPKLPNSLQILHCSNNSLTSLPKLPNSLQKLYC
jgi:Leucine-rich repeat (LRR) protein